MMHRLSRLTSILGLVSLGAVAAAGAAPWPGSGVVAHGRGASVEGELTLTASLGAKTAVSWWVG